MRPTAFSPVSLAIMATLALVVAWLAGAVSPWWIAVPIPVMLVWVIAMAAISAVHRELGR